MKIFVCLALCLLLTGCGPDRSVSDEPEFDATASVSDELVVPDGTDGDVLEEPEVQPDDASDEVTESDETQVPVPGTEGFGEMEDFIGGPPAKFDFGE